MTNRDFEDGPPGPSFLYRRSSSIALIVSVTVLRVVYLVFFCPYDLVGDEAYYWLWSKHLALSYYSKGPGIAWLIAASTRLLGDTEAAVRIPAALSMGVAAWATGALAWRMTRDARVELLTVALFLLAPMLQGTALVGTIDAPFLACWSVAALLCYEVLAYDTRRRWWLLGVVVGIGVLFKHTMLLAIVAIVLSTLLARRRLGVHAWFGVALFVLIVAPALLSDRANGWPAVHHLIGHLHVPGGDVAPAVWHFNPLSTLTILLLLLAILGPAAIPGVIELFRARDDARDAVPTLFCVVPLAFYAAVSIFTKVQGNWLLPACLTLLPLAARAFLTYMNIHTRRLLVATVVVGVMTGTGMLRLDLVARLPFAGRLVPTQRLFSAKPLAAAVEQEIATGAHIGDSPLIVASQYGVASQLAFYLAGHPRTYCSGGLPGGRPSQFDLWPETKFARTMMKRRLIILVTPAFAGVSEVLEESRNRRVGGLRISTGIGR